MSGLSHELAQVTVARLQAPLDRSQLWDLVTALDPDGIAETAEGFRWRFHHHPQQAEARLLANGWLLVSLATWCSVESLASYVYGHEPHPTPQLRREHDGPLGGAATALWWVPAGHRPTAREAQQRLDHLTEFGPLPYAFTLHAAFPPPGQPFVGTLRSPLTEPALG